MQLETRPRNLNPGIGHYFVFKFFIADTDAQRRAITDSLFIAINLVS